ncbi:MAG: hypothetical protein L0Y74_02510, partial [candidate division Zixibacteria bacterium]|nr:hypothetical protein [candidate division Zixibacteria bacterium]
MLAVFILLGFTTGAFAQCIGYLDSFDVRVLDGQLRPVEGALVTVKFDRGASFGDQYFTTAPKATDASGKVHFDIANQGTLTRPIDCKIVINGTAGGETKIVTVEANKHGPIVDVHLGDVYPVRFFVRDQLKAPIPNASVTLGNKSGKTDQFGSVKFFFKTGIYDYLASYQNAQQAGQVNVSNDTEFEVLFPYYKVSISVKDDNGQPLAAKLTIFNQSFEMQNGLYVNEKTFGDAVPYSVDYQGIVTDDIIYPASDPVVELTYDIHAPLFGEIKSEIVSGRPRLTIVASDPGQYASGLNVSSIKVRYKIGAADDSTPWSTAVTFTAGKDKFNSEFPELPKNSIVTFAIEIKDKAGNRADIQGKFSTFAENQTNTTNQTNTQPE